MSRSRVPHWRGDINLSIVKYSCLRKQYNGFIMLKDRLVNLYLYRIAFIPALYRIRNMLSSFSCYYI